MARRLYLAAYDVTELNRLRASLELVKAYATGGQKSAYECWLSETEKSELLHNMALLLNEAEDRFVLIGLDPRSNIHTLGKAITSTDPNTFYIS